jgi:hypothetical protein
MPAANEGEENEPQPNDNQVTVLTNEQQQLAHDLGTPLDSSQLLHVNSSSSQAAANPGAQLQLQITVRCDAPLFSSLVVEYVARGCGSSDSAAAQPVVLIAPIDGSTGSGPSVANFGRLSIPQSEDGGTVPEVRDYTI